MTESSEFRTTLENFTGPLDLLLYLIRKDEIDVLDIPIAKVLEQYEQFVQFLADIDVNLAADYLVMATTLMEIKSRMLLPQDATAGEEDELEDPRSELVKQLLEYRTYKERALYLARKLEEESRRFTRTSSELPFPLDHVELGKLSLWDVVTAFMRIQKAIAANRPGEVVFTERPITFYMDLIQETFTAAGSRTVPFEDVFLRRMPIDRYTLVGTFLAILEFVKLGALALDRDDATGGIVILLRVDSLADCMRNLATHANIGEDLPEVEDLADIAVTPPPEAGEETPDAHEIELDPETREALAQLDPTANEADEQEPDEEDDDTLVLSAETAAEHDSGELPEHHSGESPEHDSGQSPEHGGDIAPEEPDDSVPDAADAETERPDERERADPCA